MNRSGYILLALFLILIAVAMFAASFILIRKDSSSRAVIVPTTVATFTPAPTPIPTPTPLPDGAFLYSGQALGLVNTSDADGDWVSDRLEYNQYETNPLLIDTDGGGVDDFNEIFIYDMDPLSAVDDAEFLAQIPNVEANDILYNGGGVYVNVNETLPFLNFIKGFSEHDPFIQWVADNTFFVWNGAGETSGSLYVKWPGEYQPLFGKWVDHTHFITPARYFSNGRQGTCADSAIAQGVLLELKGYDCVLVGGNINGNGHAWLEVTRGDKIYVVTYNDAVLASDWYS